MSNQRNVFKEQLSTIYEIKSNDNLIICRDDKDGTVVNMHTGLYVQQVYNILNNTNTYRRLTEESHFIYKNGLHNLIK